MPPDSSTSISSVFDGCKRCWCWLSRGARASAPLRNVWSLVIVVNSHFDVIKINDANSNSRNYGIRVQWKYRVVYFVRLCSINILRLNEMASNADVLYYSRLAMLIVNTVQTYIWFNWRFMCACDCVFVCFDWGICVFMLSWIAWKIVCSSKYTVRFTHVRTDKYTHAHNRTETTLTYGQEPKNGYIYI